MILVCVRGVRMWKRAKTEKKKSRLIRPEKFWASLSNLPVGQVPEFPQLKLPRNLAAVSDRKLGNLLSRYAAVGAYYDELLARAEIDFAICKQNTGYLRSKLLLRAAGRTIAERKAHRSTRPELLRSKEELLKSRALYVMLLTYRRTSERYFQCVSREVSRREAEQRGRARD